MNKKIGLSIFFIIYLVLLVWLIIFKLNFSLEEIEPIRRVNFNPFYYITKVPKGFSLVELIANILIFIPFGFFLVGISGYKNLFGKMMFIVFVSVAFEIVQYIHAIGVSDITDVFANTIGGFIGLIIALVYAQLVKY